MSGGDEHDAAVGQALQEATGGAKAQTTLDLGDQHAVVLGSGNLGLVYLMEEKRRLTAEEITQRHPRLLGALGAHPDIGFLLVRSAEHGPLALNSRGTITSPTAASRARTRSAQFSANAPAHLLRTDGFEHVADIMVGSFYDPRARARVRVRGADFVPRRPRRPADQAVSALSGRTADADRADRRRGPASTRSSAAGAAARGRTR